MKLTSNNHFHIDVSDAPSSPSRYACWFSELAFEMYIKERVSPAACYIVSAKYKPDVLRRMGYCEKCIERITESSQIKIKAMKHRMLGA